MELPPQDFHANIVDYYENMRDSHWSPRFLQLSLDLAGRLLNVRAACTSLSVDRWPEAQLTLLTNTQSLLRSATNSTNSPDSNLVTFQLLKHILANSIPLDSVFGGSLEVTEHICRPQTWPQMQHHFSKLRQVIMTSQKTLPPPTPPPLPPVLPTFFPGLISHSLVTPLLLPPMGPFLLPQTPLPMSLAIDNFLYTPTQSQTPANIMNGLLALTSNQPRLPQTLITGIPPGLLAAAIPSPHLPYVPPPPPPPPPVGPSAANHLVTGDIVGLAKSMLSHLQVVCFRDEAKTRFMCSKCNKQWTSMKGAITFVVILSHQLSNVQLMDWLIRPGANVLFELFPQACGDCTEKRVAVLCPPKWYPEEVDKVLRNLFVNIHRTFYRNVITWDQQFDRRRRPGHPTGRHDNTKCIACLNGMCVSALVHSSGSSQSKINANGQSADQGGSQSECSPACKRRLVPPPDASPNW